MVSEVEPSESRDLGQRPVASLRGANEGKRRQSFPRNDRIGVTMLERMDRVKKLIKNEVCAILSEDINDPRIQHVTVTDVEVSRDLKNATILYVVEDEETNKKEVAKGLKSASGFVRGELAERISMKFIPRVIFRLDIRKEREESVDRLFDRIAEEHGESSDEMSEGE